MKQIVTLICSLFIFTVCLHAETSSDDSTQNYINALKTYNDAVQQLQPANLRSQKKEIINKAVSITPEQSQKFWSIYNKYEAEVIKINDTRLALIAEYMNQQDGISSEKATELINSVMQIQTQRQELKRSYVKKLGTVLTAKQALRLLLLENQIDLQIDAQIPL